MIKTFNDPLALVIVLLVFFLWTLSGAGVIKLPGEILGATIATFTLITQFYFRKKPTQ